MDKEKYCWVESAAGGLQVQSPQSRDNPSARGGQALIKQKTPAVGQVFCF